MGVQQTVSKQGINPKITPKTVHKSFQCVIVTNYKCWVRCSTFNEIHCRFSLCVTNNLTGSKNGFEANETCYGLNCVPEKDVEVLTPCVFMNVTLFGNRFFEDVIKLSRGPQGRL